MCFNALSGLSCYSYIFWCRVRVDVSMPSRAWVVTVTSLGSTNAFAKFQCPLGLELLQLIAHWTVLFLLCFNALSGLSCYIFILQIHFSNGLFQCPLGLELLQLFWLTRGDSQCVSMPSRAWVVTLHQLPVHPYQVFQCPLGLELLQQECPIF